MRPILRASALVLFTVAALSGAGAATFTVTTVADAGPGSVRQAILDANASAGADVIEFAIPGTGPHTIALASELDPIGESVTIDGTTQPGFVDPVVTLDGAAVGGVSSGLKLTAGTSTVRGLVIQGFTIGVFVDGGSGHLVAGNWLRSHVLVRNAPFVTIGGIAPGDRNVIGGGVATQQADNLVIEGNYIGVAADGVTPTPTTYPLNIELSDDVRVGGLAAGAGNVISGWNFRGMSIGPGQSGMVVQGNRIGTDVTGTIAHDNSGPAIVVLSGSGASIGGSAVGAGNRIVGEVTVDSDATSIEGNEIGVDASGTTVLAFEGAGIRVLSSSNVIRDNVIAGAGGPGVWIVGDADVENEIRTNSLFGNGGRGIVLGAGPIPSNDPGDADAGPNDLLNFPMISSVVVDATDTTVTGTLDGAASSSFTLDFFGNTECDDGSFFGEGKTLLGSEIVSTDPAGHAGFSFTFPNPTPATEFVTITATDGAGNTSEFSPCFTDTDLDGVLSFEDNCAFTPNPGQTDTDGDGVGDPCDACPGFDDRQDTDGDAIADGCDADDDADGLADGLDNCPMLANAFQTDIDGDSVGDPCDNCVLTANLSQSDGDADGIGDDCDCGLDVDTSGEGNDGECVLDCTLREAVALAPAGCELRSFIADLSNSLAIDKQLALRDARVRGNAPGGGLLSIESSVDVALVSTHVEFAIAAAGVAVEAGSSLSVIRGTVQFVTPAAGTDGGGISSSGTVSVVESSIVGNDATGDGGGIRSDGSLTLLGSLVSDNESARSGGGVAIQGGDLTVIDSTISFNRANALGGGISVSGTGSPWQLAGSTVVANSAGRGGGILAAPRPAASANSIIALNSATIEPDCTGTIDSQGYNLIGDTTGCTIVGDTTGNLPGANPNLDGLRDNGGPTLTHALLPGSPAIDAGNPAVPGSGGAACAAADQRGVPRASGTRCDIGAYEVADLDAVDTALDCAPLDATTWDIPSETLDLRLSQGTGGATTLVWSPPAIPGAVAVAYDVLVSPQADDFDAAADCADTDGGDRTAVDLVRPSAGAVRHFLVRAGTECGEGPGGTSSSGQPRVVRDCP